MIRWLDFLLVLYLVYQSGILPVGNNPIKVTGEKGGNVTLTCEFKDHNILQLELFDQTGYIVCENEGCTGQSIKKGACDVIIKDLSFSDAGKYTLTIYDDDNQTELESKSRDYHLHIHGNISAKIGKPLKMDVLLFNADKVETNSSGEWKEVWTRGHRVQNDRLNDSDGNLIIKEFMDTDSGTYRVLDSEGEILITVTVTESSPESGSKGGQRNTKNDTEQQKPDREPNLNGTDVHGTNENNWILPVAVVAVVVVVLGVILFVALKKCPRRDRNIEGRNHREVQPLNQRLRTTSEVSQTAQDD